MGKWLFFLCLLLCGEALPREGRFSYEDRRGPWGKDTELVDCVHSDPAEARRWGSGVCTRMIRFYQTKISPIDGPRSGFVPSSSEYALQAICRFGVLKGIALGCDRLLRENPEKWIYPVIDTPEGVRKVNPIPEKKRE